VETAILKCRWGNSPAEFRLVLVRYLPKAREIRTRLEIRTSKWRMRVDAWYYSRFFYDVVKELKQMSEGKRRRVKIYDLDQERYLEMVRAKWWRSVEISGRFAVDYITLDELHLSPKTREAADSTVAAETRFAGLRFPLDSLNEFIGTLENYLVRKRASTKSPWFERDCELYPPGTRYPPRELRRWRSRGLRLRGPGATAIEIISGDTKVGETK